MKRRFFILFMAFISAILLFLLNRQNLHLPQRNEIAASNAAISLTTLSSSTPSNKIGNQRESSFGSPRAQENSTGGKDELRTTGNAPIAFYGKVVDQDNHPIPGVQITIELFVGYLKSPNEGEMRHDRVVLKTDEHGDFTLTNVKGHSITIVSVIKEGYELSKKSGLFYAYSSSSEIFRPDASNPVVFKMWKKIPPATLVRFQRDLRIPYDGTPVVFDLLTGKQVQDDGHSGDVRITLVRNPLKIIRGKTKYDWSATIEAVDGGVIESNDEFLFLAPENGYQPKIEIGFQRDDPQWQSNATISFYFRSRGEKNYGSVTAEFRTGSDKPETGFSFASSVNPNGSRNLQP